MGAALTVGQRCYGVSSLLWSFSGDTPVSIGAATALGPKCHKALAQGRLTKPSWLVEYSYEDIDSKFVVRGSYSYLLAVRQRQDHRIRG